MKTVSMYQANDGKRFTSKADCRLYETIVKQRDTALSQLETIADKDCSFANGGGYIQHDPEKVKKVKLQYLKLIELNTEWKDLKKAVKNQKENLDKITFLGRYLDDSDSYFRSGYYRLFMCIDELGREWGQPYYRLNPHEGKQKQLN